MAVIEEVETVQVFEPAAEVANAEGGSNDVRSEVGIESTAKSQDGSIENQINEQENIEEERFSIEEEQKLVSESGVLRQQGNDLFNQADYQSALAKYEQALKTCPKYLSEPRSIIYANIGACFLKLDNLQECVKSCTQALKLDPTYVKALMRRATANDSIGSWSALQSASEDYSAVINLSPSSSSTSKAATIAMAKLKPRLESAQKQETAEMLGKLKDLGNSILKPFGFSTDNFKLQPDGKGGYSMNFQK
ncbi:uncharacterized protein V1516DRAFT_249569 [Lipomyces oligophaga]|uniref:uncharacterized protein n=1 Tax=Lipomyces oligophaga TaxID=45792 RepID=UPI0034CEF03D